MALSLKKVQLNQYIIHREVLCLLECVWRELRIIRLIIGVALVVHSFKASTVLEFLLS